MSYVNGSPKMNWHMATCLVYARLTFLILSGNLT
jgi:hypothetical protein